MALEPEKSFELKTRHVSFPILNWLNVSDNESSNRGGVQKLQLLNAPKPEGLDSN
jgi:hypothetical protein